MQTTLDRLWPHASSAAILVAIVAACSSADTGSGTAPPGSADGSVTNPGDDGGAAGSDADLGPCPADRTRCGSACVNLLDDKANCGQCGKPCFIGCAAGKCMTSCSPQTDCDGYCKDLTSDYENCNACGNRCPKGQACIAGACKCGPPKTLAADIQPILTLLCADAACHGPTSPKASLSLSVGKSYAALVNVKSGCKSKTRVVPGDADLSYLVDKLVGGPGTCGSMMPSGGAAMGKSDFQAIRSWICNGAAP